MADIFISYARQDRARIERLAGQLEAEGHSIWWDRHIAGGAEFSKDIERELQSAKAVIVGWSKGANESRWVKDEAGLAANAGKLIAISLDGSEPPIGFRQFHALDYTKPDSAAFAELTRSIALKLSLPARETQSVAAGRDRKKTLAIVAGLAVGALAFGYAIISNLTQNTAAPDDAARRASIVSDTAGPPPDVSEYESIAVLAFSDLSPEQDQEYFSDGVSEELLNVLARETDFRVAARTSSFSFKGKDETIASIGAALNVDAVLEGSVRKSGERIRVTAQLIDVQSGYHLWSDTFDRDLADVFQVQDEIARSIVRSLPSNAPAAQIGASPSTNDNAYDLFLQGRHQLTRRTRLSIEHAKTLFEQALSDDPDYAPAWAGLATATLLLVEGQSTYGDLTREETEAIAAPAIEKALALDPNLAEAYTAQGLLLGQKGDISGSAEAQRKAIELNPSVANTRHLLYLVLTSDGAFEEAFRVIDDAVVRDPLSAITLENHVASLLLRGRFADALAAAHRLHNLHPDWHHAKTALGRAYAANGNLAQAAHFLVRAANASGGDNLDVEAAFHLISLKMFDHPLLARAPVDPVSFKDVLQGRNEEARSLAMDNFATYPDSPFALWRAVWTLWATGNDVEALEMSENFARREESVNAYWAIRPANCYPGLYVAGLRQRAGDLAGAQPLLQACRQSLTDAAEQGVVLPYYERDMSAELLVLEGRHEEALVRLRELTNTGLFFSWWIAFEPIYAPLHDDPRFIEIVSDITARIQKERALFLAIGDN